MLRLLNKITEFDANNIMPFPFGKLGCYIFTEKFVGWRVALEQAASDPAF